MLNMEYKLAKQLGKQIFVKYEPRIWTTLLSIYYYSIKKVIA